MSWLTPDLIDILLSILKAVVILLVVVTCGAFMSWRASSARLVPEPLRTLRVAGAVRCSWSPTIKMFFKEDPRCSDRVIFTLAVIAFTSLLLAFAIVPVSPTWGGRPEHRHLLPDDGRLAVCGAVRRLVEQ